jgi:hypothetical protein
MVQTENECDSEILPRWRATYLRLRAHWQRNCCGDQNAADGGIVGVRALQLISCLYLWFFYCQYIMNFTEATCVCALLLGIREGRRRKRYWVHPIVSQRLLNGQFYKLYEDLKNYRGKFISYFRMSIESFGNLLVLVGPRITYQKYTTPAICATKRKTGCNCKVKNLYFYILFFFIHYFLSL